MFSMVLLQSQNERESFVVLLSEMYIMEIVHRYHIRGLPINSGCPHMSERPQEHRERVFFPERGVASDIAGAISRTRSCPSFAGTP